MFLQMSVILFTGGVPAPVGRVPAPGGLSGLGVGGLLCGVPGLGDLPDRVGGWSAPGGGAA